MDKVLFIEITYGDLWYAGKRGHKFFVINEDSQFYYTKYGSVYKDHTVATLINNPKKLIYNGEIVHLLGMDYSQQRVMVLYKNKDIFTVLESETQQKDQTPFPKGILTSDEIDALLGAISNSEQEESPKQISFSDFCETKSCSAKLKNGWFITVFDGLYYVSDSDKTTLHRINIKEKYTNFYHEYNDNYDIVEVFIGNASYSPIKTSENTIAIKNKIQELEKEIEKLKREGGLI